MILLDRTKSVWTNRSSEAVGADCIWNWCRHTFEFLTLRRMSFRHHELNGQEKRQEKLICFVGCWLRSTKSVETCKYEIWKILFMAPNHIYDVIFTIFTKYLFFRINLFFKKSQIGLCLETWNFFYRILKGISYDCNGFYSYNSISDGKLI